MKTIVIILIAFLSILLLTFFGWYLFFRNQDIPVEEAILGILPFGSAPTPAEVGVPTSGPTGASEEIDAKPATKLFRISDAPVAGFVVFTKNNRVTVRYVDRATGHIYDATLPATSTAVLENTKVSNKTLPKIYEAYFRPDGNAILLRSLKNDSDVVENFSLTLTSPKATVSTSSPQASTLYAISSTALRGDMGAIAVGSGNTLIYTLRDASSIVSSAFNGTGVKTLLSSPFKDWRVSTAGNSLILYTKASVNVSGFAYTLNTSTGAFAKILGPLNGLTAVPNTAGNRVLYSYVGNNQTRLFAKNLVKNTLTEILPTTLAEKCVWSTKKVDALFCSVPVDVPKPGEPDNWYRGLTHFSDRLWRFDTNINIAQVLMEPEQLGAEIDAIELKLSPGEDYLVFINKNDLSLWVLKLEPF